MKTSLKQEYEEEGLVSPQGRSIRDRFSMSGLARQGALMGVGAVVMVALIVVMGGWTPFPAHASASTLVGTWKGTTFFQKGPRAGQSEIIMLAFAKDGGLTVTIEGLPVTTGRWAMAGDTPIYTFLQLVTVPDQGSLMVSVLHTVRFPRGTNSFVSEGAGIAYSSQGDELHRVLINETETVMTRQPL